MAELPWLEDTKWTATETLLPYLDLDCKPQVDGRVAHRVWSARRTAFNRFNLCCQHCLSQGHIAVLGNSKTLPLARMVDSAAIRAMSADWPVKCKIQAVCYGLYHLYALVPTNC